MLARSDIDATRPLPGTAYTARDVFEHETRQIFARSWICVGREEEIARSGEWVRVVVSGEPVLVVRGADLKLRAFSDVCRHRGASVVGRKACGRSAELECPYHGWTYALDGRGRADLLPLHVSTWRGFVFVALCNDPPSTGEPPPWLDALGPLKLARRTSWTTRANWKLCVENFQESLHFSRVHGTLEALTPSSSAGTWMGSGRWMGGSMDIVGAETVSRSGSLASRSLIGPPGRVHDAMLFPLLLTSLQPDYLLMYRLSPVAPDETQITFDVWFHPASNIDAPDVYSLWDEINAEDRAIVEDQQANASSRGFAPVAYEEVEEGVRAFDAMVVEHYPAVRDET